MGSKISGKMFSIAQTVRPVLNEVWVKRPLGPPGLPRSNSRTSTRTRAASLEKLHRTGSIKINQSIISKWGNRVVKARSILESRSVTIQQRIGSWIPVDCNLNNENNKGFYIL